MRSRSGVRNVLAGLVIAAAVAAVSLTAVDRAGAAQRAVDRAHPVAQEAVQAVIALTPVTPATAVNTVDAVVSIDHDVRAVCVAPAPDDPRMAVDSLDNPVLPERITATLPRRYDSRIAPLADANAHRSWRQTRTASASRARSSARSSLVTSLLPSPITS
jgi:hypothetical protein